MIYNNIERVLVIIKWILNYYNTGFSLEITPKVQKVSQKYTFIHKLTTKRNFQTPSLFFSCSKTRRIKNVKLSASQSRDKKCVRAYYEGNLQEVQNDYKGWV